MAAVGPIDLLKRCVADKATGMLTAQSDDLGIQIFIQSGRIAYATSSTGGRRLINYLVNHCPIDKPTLKEVIEASIQANKPFAETLIDDGYATVEQVRTALMEQIADTLAELVPMAPETAHFDPNQEFGTYREDLVFDFREFSKALLLSLSRLQLK